MILEVNDLNVLGVLVNTKNGVKFISADEFLKELKTRVDNLDDKVKAHETQLKQLTKDDIVKVVDECKNKVDNDYTKETLVRYMAFEALNDDINYKGMDYPDNYAEIQKYVEDPGETIPAGFEKYINIFYKPVKEEK